MKQLLLFLILLLPIVSFANYAVVDFSKPSNEKRFFIYSNSGKLLFATYTTHGSGSGRGLYPTHFSNSFGSLASSLGKYKIVEVNYGRHGKAYRLKGLDNSNSNAYTRYIEIHGADYIGNGRTGTSWGCFAVPFKDLERVLSLLNIGDKLVTRD